MNKKKWILFAVLFVIAIYFASLYGGNIPFMFLKFVISVPIIAALYTLLVTWRFKFYQKIGEQTVVKGEPVDYYFSLTNEDHFFYDSIHVKFRDDFSNLVGEKGEQEFHLLPGESKKIKAKLCCNYRGEYAVGVDAFDITDYLHLICFHYVEPSPLKILVLPRITKWCYEEDILLKEDGKNRGMDRSNGDYDVMVRNYVTGDPLRQIHWKATARNAKLMSREQATDRRQEMAIFFDLNRKENLDSFKLAYEDEMVEQLVAAVHACRKRNIPCNIFLCGKSGKEIRVESLEQWNVFYQICGKLRFEDNEHRIKIHLSKHKLENMKFAVIFTEHADSELMKEMKHELPGVEMSIIQIRNAPIEEKDESPIVHAEGIRIFTTYLENRSEKYDS